MTVRGTAQAGGEEEIPISFPSAAEVGFIQNGVFVLRSLAELQTEIIHGEDQQTIVCITDRVFLRQVDAVFPDFLFQGGVDHAFADHGKDGLRICVAENIHGIREDFRDTAAAHGGSVPIADGTHGLRPLGFGITEIVLHGRFVEKGHIIIAGGQSVVDENGGAEVVIPGGIFRTDRMGFDPFHGVGGGRHPEFGRLVMIPVQQIFPAEITGAGGKNGVIGQVSGFSGKVIFCRCSHFPVIHGFLPDPADQAGGSGPVFCGEKGIILQSGDLPDQRMGSERGRTYGDPFEGIIEIFIHFQYLGVIPQISFVSGTQVVHIKGLHGGDGIGSGEPFFAVGEKSVNSVMTAFQEGGRRRFGNGFAALDQERKLFGIIEFPGKDTGPFQYFFSGTAAQKNRTGLPVKKFREYPHFVIPLIRQDA